MKPLLLLLNSSIGKKLIMAATGAALLLFAVGHLAGNLQVFLPKEHINAYAHFLHENPALIWSARLGLLVVVGLHIWAAITLSAQNKAARPQEYAGAPRPYATTWIARHMLLTGLVIAAFVIYHLLHFTAQTSAINLLPASHPAKEFGSLMVTSGPQKGFKDVHSMMVAGFQQPLVAVFYLVAVVMLALHLSHGTSSMFQSLGIREGRWRLRLELGSKLISSALFAGYAAIPVAIYLRIVQ